MAQSGPIQIVFNRARNPYIPAPGDIHHYICEEELLRIVGSKEKFDSLSEKCNLGFAYKDIVFLLDKPPLYRVEIRSSKE